MGAFDPVSWDEIESAIGPPAPEVILSAVTRWRYSTPRGGEFLHELTADSITNRVEQLQEEVQEKTPYAAAKTIHDTFSESESDPQVPGLGEPFITTYLLEKASTISPDDAEPGDYPSLIDDTDEQRVGVVFNTNEEYEPIVIRVGTTPKDFLEITT
ncbi:MAG: hypothetical protein ABEH88_03460 [Halobacteriales archaeon]